MSSWLLEIRTARCCQCCPSPHLLLKFWVCALRSVCQVGCGVESTLPLAPALSLSIPPLSHSLFCPPPPTLLFSFFSFLSKFTWVQTSAGRGSKISIVGPGEKKISFAPPKKISLWVMSCVSIHQDQGRLSEQSQCKYQQHSKKFLHLITWHYLAIEF